MRPEALDAHPCPLQLAYVWAMFRELSKMRGQGYAGAEPLRCADILAWGSIKCTPVSSFELDCIVALDRAYINACNEKRTVDHDG